MEELQGRVVYEKADLGHAFDGDADRCLAVDENGHLVDGDQIMAIIGNYMKENGSLKDNHIIVTVMSNLGFTLMAKEHGITEELKASDQMAWVGAMNNIRNTAEEIVWKEVYELV